MLDQKDKTYFDLSGALVYDPCIGDCGDVQGYIPTNQFAINNQVILNLNESTLNESKLIDRLMRQPVATLSFTWIELTSLLHLYLSKTLANHLLIAFSGKA